MARMLAPGDPLTYAQISSYSLAMRRKPGQIVPLERDILEAMLLLRARGLQEAHGFLLARTMADAEDAKRLTAYGTLYKALDRLEQAGHLVSRWEAPDFAAEAARPRRRFYRITGTGERIVALTRAEQRTVQRAAPDGVPVT